MPCLGSVAYDPTTAVTKTTTAAAAMAAFDTTNARIIFTAPSSGKVLVRIATTITGASGSMPSLLLGVLEGSTVKGRRPPFVGGYPTAAATILAIESVFVIGGLSGGSNYTWDAAYGIETGIASTGIKYGGPNDATNNNAWGALLFEVWDA